MRTRAVNSSFHAVPEQDPIRKDRQRSKASPFDNYGLRPNVHPNGRLSAAATHQSLV
jgi:hypothetical protein